MTEQDAERQRYSIKALLNAGVQPLADLGPEEFDALRKALGKHPLANPVSVSEDGLLLDGHQRLKAQLANGRVYIGAGEVHVIAGANRDNAMEWAVRLNVQRRHLSVVEKAELARSLQAQRHWSQAKIASLFGVSRPAVTQWLTKTASDAVDADPVMVQGKDGKLYPVDPVPRREPKMTRPWEPQGYGYRALSTALTRLQTEPYTGLPALKRAKLAEVLDDLIAAAGKLLDTIAAEADQHPEDDERPGR